MTTFPKYRRESGVNLNSSLVPDEPMARRGLEGSPERRERIAGGVNGSSVSKEICAGGPSAGLKNRPGSLSSIAGTSCASE